MALPASGKIGIKDILLEMGRKTERADLNNLAKLWYTRTGKKKFNNTIHKLSDWYSESWLYYGYYGSGNTYIASRERKPNEFNSSIGTL